jgi:hypothetical protein
MAGIGPETDELEIARRVKEMREVDIVDLLRDTITHLNVLTDRLESLVLDESSEPPREEAGA